MFSIGMILTVLGGIIAGAASLLDGSAIFVLWAGQAVAGLGAGLLLPTTLALIAVAVPNPMERGKYIGLWATGIVVGLAVGPLLSGSILTLAGWGWIFVRSAVLATAAGLFAHLKLPESKNAAGRHLDWPGQITATVTIAASIYGVIEGGAQGWGSPEAITGLTVGGLALIGFVVAERRSVSPVINLTLFRSPLFTAAGLAALVALFSVVGTMFLLSLFLGSVQHLDALQIGVRLLFVSGVAAIASPLLGALGGKVRPIYLLSAGLVLNAAAVVLLMSVTDDTTLVQFTWRLALFGVSLSLMLSSVSLVAINSALCSQAGMASAANTALRQTGGALGPAILRAVYVSQISAGSAPPSGLHSALTVNLVLLAVSAVICIIAAIVPTKDPNAQ